ncbi:MAG TPA: aldo/keto reductase [Caldilineaceae bacterium]|nr:aldo/keto reductase [Caldilineaceae bacterium]
MPTIPTLPLNNGYTIPQIGLGTASLDDETIASVLVTAIEAGYRHIDTAFRYGNQKGVGKGIRDSGIAREELFITTKLDGEFQGNDRAIAGFEECLRQLNQEYVDLLLIHWPLPQRDEYIDTWRTFEQLLAGGKVRSIGVSNFKPAHLDRLLAETTIRPVANQIQLSPRITRPDHVAYGRTHDIVTVAWSPLGQGKDLLNEPTLATIGAKVGKTPAQVVLRWFIELGVVAISRSSNPARLRQNIELFDFTLSADEVAAISALDTGAEKRVDSDTMGH